MMSLNNVFDKLFSTFTDSKQKYVDYTTVVERAKWQKDMEDAGVEFF